MKIDDVIYELDNAFAAMWNSEAGIIDKSDRPDEEKALAIAIEAMKKQEPMKVVETIDEYYECPKCFSRATHNVMARGFHTTRYYEYCYHCGQKLSWEETE